MVGGQSGTARFSRGARVQSDLVGGSRGAEGGQQPEVKEANYQPQVTYKLVEF
jgi:hypothetical protein